MLSCGRRAAEVVARNPTVRGLASLPAEQVRGSSEIAETVRLSPTAPLLLRLSQRPWGATATLPASSLPADAPATVAVLRDAWAAHDQTPRPLAELIHPLSPCTAAVAASAADWHSRVLVDVYERPAAGGDHALKTVAGDLFHLLRSAGIRPLHVPDVPAVAAQAARLNCLASGARGVRQSTNEVLMVAPTAFGFNEQAAQDNTFMHTGAGAASDAGPSVTHRVVREFAGLHRELADVAGVRVNLFQHSLAHGTPDAVFPNNWFSTHAAGEGGGAAPSSLVLYPMKCPNRAAEAREDVVGVLRALGHAAEVNLAGEEGAAAGGAGRVLEGTGSLVLDRVNGVAYVALSERADAALADDWARRLGYDRVVAFSSGDGAGGAVYHTNVMMAVGTDLAVACLASVADDGERRALRQALERHHTLVDITRDQMAAMCGNVLELEDGRGLPVLAMSTRAYNAFTEEQRRTMRRHVAALHHAPIDTLEHIGGGSVRCTLGEIFRP
ncbi:hypothetical protein ACKKBG_A17635 [Auxenochlorella protothecoides x Auxenochlorella symbiontica]|uniref:Amidinotransferase n=2 Tax=Auxenochlorella protothecoides TaxID=3075 RepID=A0A3M7KXA7_AUXPR|nr:hypothetical protein APUTEX25_002085 [Auxenochlorella protothecoides]|eukprot:RMZ54509.1 hypothetical protein APUTEX25_002085 [Auxenochlorella protothecoides]